MPWMMKWNLRNQSNRFRKYVSLWKRKWCSRYYVNTQATVQDSRQVTRCASPSSNCVAYCSRIPRNTVYTRAISGQAVWLNISKKSMANSLTLLSKQCGFFMRSRYWPRLMRSTWCISGYSLCRNPCLANGFSSILPTYKELSSCTLRQSWAWWRGSWKRVVTSWPAYFLMRLWPPGCMPAKWVASMTAPLQQSTCFLFSEAQSSAYFKPANLIDYQDWDIDKYIYEQSNPQPLVFVAICFVSH